MNCVNLTGMSLCWMQSFKFKKQKLESKFTHTISLLKKQSIADLQVGQLYPSLWQENDMMSLPWTIGLHILDSTIMIYMSNLPGSKSSMFQIQVCYKFCRKAIYKHAPRSKSTKVATLDLIHSLTSMMDLIWYVPRAPVVYVLLMVAI